MFATTILGATISAVWAVMLAVLWVFVAIWPAMIAKRKGYSFLLFFIVSLFFWWIMFFVVIFMKDKSGPTATPTVVAE